MTAPRSARAIYLISSLILLLALFHTLYLMQFGPSKCHQSSFFRSCRSRSTVPVPPETNFPPGLRLSQEAKPRRHNKSNQDPQLDVFPASTSPSAANISTGEAMQRANGSTIVNNLVHFLLVFDQYIGSPHLLSYSLPYILFAEFLLSIFNLFSQLLFLLLC